MYKFKEFVTRCHLIAQEKFIQLFPQPLLLIEKLGKTDSSKGTTGRFKNPAHNIADIRGKRIGILPVELSLVFDLNKAKVNQSFLISVGRGDNNSICLKDNTISKFHAYFENVEGEWSITDANSNNGTLINNQLLEPKDPHPLKSGDAICFGFMYLATFFSSEDFYEYIQWAEGEKNRARVIKRSILQHGKLRKKTE